MCDRVIVVTATRTHHEKQLTDSFWVIELFQTPQLDIPLPDQDGRGGECPHHAVDLYEAEQHLQTSLYEHPQ